MANFNEVFPGNNPLAVSSSIAEGRWGKIKSFLGKWIGTPSLALLAALAAFKFVF